MMFALSWYDLRSDDNNEAHVMYRPMALVEMCTTILNMIKMLHFMQ